MSLPLVSVIIPVYNDAERLRLCLTALENQTLPKQQYEVVVVDNNSAKDLKPVVQAYQQARLIHETCPGSYSARNRGILAARGNALAFTDSDCIPNEDWLEKGLHHLFSTSSCGLIAGEIQIFFKVSNQPNPIELYDSLFNLQQKKYIEEQGWGATANLFTSKEIFNQVGLFNAGLKSGGDAEWGKRVSSSGYTVLYAQDCCVRHPARSSLKEIHRKIRRTLQGVYTLSQTSQHEQVLKLFTLQDNVLTQLRPPLRSALRKSYQDQRLNRPRQKIMIFMLVFFFHYLRVFEIFRLRTQDLKTTVKV